MTNELDATLQKMLEHIRILRPNPDTAIGRRFIQVYDAHPDGFVQNVNVTSVVRTLHFDSGDALEDIDRWHRFADTMRPCQRTSRDEE